MRTYFQTPSGLDKKVIVPKNSIIGLGEAGGKSRALAKFLPLIENAFKPKDGYAPYLETLPQVAITPMFFKDFLNRAFENKDPKTNDVYKTIEKCPFTNEETEGIREALAPFAGLYVAVRSDEATSAGVGLWHTDFMIADTSEDAVNRACGIIKEILASDLSEDVVAFKKRTGIPLENTTGVLVMPIYTRPILPEDKVDFVSPLFSMNFLTNFSNGKHLVQIGLGLGGANGIYNITIMLPNPSKDKDRIDNMGYNFRHTGPRVLKGGRDGVDVNHFLLDYARDTRKFEDVLEDIHSIAETISNKIGPSYFEIAWAPPAVLTQFSQVNYKTIKAPEIPEIKKIVRIRNYSHEKFNANGWTLPTNAIQGRDIIRADKVYYIKYNRNTSYTYNNTRKPLHPLPEINKYNKDYVLVIEGIESAYSFGLDFSFSSYSNAAAIVLVNTRCINIISSHIGGATREAGIPIFAGKIDGYFIWNLKENEFNKRNLLIYANDGLGEGFIANMD